MPEHIHLLARPAEGKKLGPALHGLKVSFGKRALGRWKSVHAPVVARLYDEGGALHFWQVGGGFDRNVRNMAAFTRHVQYIHENPVNRGLVEAADDWKWSSVHWWMRGQAGTRVSCAIECDQPPESHRYDWKRWEGYRKWPAGARSGCV